MQVLVMPGTNKVGDFFKFLFISFLGELSCHHHHQLNVHFLPRSIKGMDGCFPTALGKQSTFSNILGPFV